MHCYSSVNKHVHAFQCYCTCHLLIYVQQVVQLAVLQVAVATVLVLTTVATVGVLICANHKFMVTN